MKNPFRRYGQLGYEQKIIVHTVISVCLSAVLAAGKFVVGLFADFNLCTIALYTAALAAAKAECVLGARTDAAATARRNTFAAVFMIASSAVYTAFMARTLIMGREPSGYGMGYTLAVAFISFAELGFALAGIFKTKNGSHYCRAVKIINFCIALIAILTAQTTILDFTSTQNAYIYNSYTGMGVGAFIAACAVYLLAAPHISVTGREHNTFVLVGGKVSPFADGDFSLTLCRSLVYGDYIYRATSGGGRVDGDIVRGQSLWNRMPLPLKILCCVLSEILVFVWLAGRAVLFVRSADLPGRLKKIMAAYGYIKAEDYATADGRELNK